MDYSPRYGRFRALLRKIREEAGLTQAQLAEQMGKPQSFVSKSELGERRIDFLETVDFCEACSVELAEFMQRLVDQDGEIERKKKRKPRSMDEEGRVS